MSRQNKNKRVIAKRVQVTALHKKGVAETGFKRTSLNKKTRSKYSIAFTQKLTSAKKGRTITVTAKRPSIPKKSKKIDLESMS